MIRSPVIVVAMLGLIAGCSVPGHRSTSSASPVIGDSCLIGRWVDQKETAPGNWTWNKEVIAVSGFSGLLITYSAGGTETDDLTETQPLIGDFHGHQIKIVIRGTVGYVVRADGSHIVQANATGTPTATFYYDGAVRPGGTVSFPASTNSYRCNATSLHIESPAANAGYGPQVDDLTRS